MGPKTGANATDMEGRQCCAELEGCQDCSSSQKRNPQSCANWSGISLLNVSIRVLQEIFTKGYKSLLKPSYKNFSVGL